MCRIAAELPEAFAHAGAAAAMHAQAHRGGQMVGLHHQGRQAGRQAIGFVLKRGELAQTRLISKGQKRLWQSRSITPAVVAPSARAEKFSAMRWRSTGPASATTSSVEGARRPSSRARARTASIRAWLARGPG